MVLNTKNDIFHLRDAVSYMYLVQFCSGSYREDFEHVYVGVGFQHISLHDGLEQKMIFFVSVTTTKKIQSPNQKKKYIIGYMATARKIWRTDKYVPKSKVLHNPLSTA